MAAKKGADEMTSREKETVGLCPSDRAQLQRLPGSECASGAKRGLRQSGEHEPCKQGSRHSADYGHMAPSGHVSGHFTES